MTSLFARNGAWLAKHPWSFLVIPIVVSILFGLGFMGIQLESSSEYLYTPSNGRAKEEKKLVQDNFPLNDSYMFLPKIGESLDGLVYATIVAEDGGNVFTAEGLQAAMDVDQIIVEISTQQVVRYTMT